MGARMEFRLIVMRHAKSDWDAGASTDHERPLNKRGRRDSPRVATRLMELGWGPDYVLSSDSQRTTETFQLMAPLLDAPEVVFLSALYHAGIGALQDAVVSVPEGTTTLMALGHNPGWQDCVHRLTGEYEPMTTANAALMTVDAESWASAITRHGDWQLEQIVRPKEL